MEIILPISTSATARRVFEVMLVKPVHKRVTNGSLVEGLGAHDVRSSSSVPGRYNEQQAVP